MNDPKARINQLERELKTKVLEIKDLKERLAFYHNQQENRIDNPEMDKVKRDKSIAVSLVNTMQKDLSNKVFEFFKHELDFRND
jgi:hypothetical protein